jgi:hypothetical protein
MPDSHFTEFCKRCGGILEFVHAYGKNVLQPNIFAVSKDKFRTDRSRDAAVAAIYLQIFMWLGSLERINETRDFLAIGAGSRSIFELLLDLRWFQKFNGQEWGKRFWAFEHADRHRVASNVVKYKRENPESAIDETFHQNWLDSNPDADPMVSGLWLTSDGKPKLPGNHWTGEGTLRTRAKKIDPFYEEVYLHVYPILSWTTHAGPSAIFKGDFAEIEKHIAHAYALGIEHSLDAAVVTCNVLEITEKINGFDDFVREVRKRLDAAYKTLPSIQ